MAAFLSPRNRVGSKQPLYFLAARNVLSAIIVFEIGRSLLLLQLGKGRHGLEPRILDGKGAGALAAAVLGIVLKPVASLLHGYISKYNGRPH